MCGALASRRHAMAGLFLHQKDDARELTLYSALASCMQSCPLPSSMSVSFRGSPLYVVPLLLLSALSLLSM